MVYNENGTYTAVRRRATHRCTRSPPEAMPLPNRGVLSAAPCTIKSQFMDSPVRGVRWGDLSGSNGGGAMLLKLKQVL